MNDESIQKARRAKDAIGAKHRRKAATEDTAIMRTRGQLEAEIGEAIIKFEKEYMGRGPEETKTYLIDDMILIRLRGVLTPAEKNLAQIDGSNHGRALIKQVRIELLEKARGLLEVLVRDITGRKMRSLHTDISTLTGERVIIFTLDGVPQFEDTDNAGRKVP